MQVPYIANQFLWCATLAKMQQEEILEYMKGHDVFMIRTSESQIHHTGLMLHKWWEMPGTTFPDGYESRQILHIIWEAKDFSLLSWYVYSLATTSCLT